MNPSTLFRPQSARRSEFDLASHRLRLSGANKYLALILVCLFALLISFAVFAQYRPSTVLKATVSTLEPSVPISLPEGSYLTQIRVSHGELVEAGDIVAEIAWREPFDQVAIQRKQLGLLNYQKTLSYEKYQQQLRQVERERQIVSEQIMVQEKSLERRTLLAHEYGKIYEQVAQRRHKIDNFVSSDAFSNVDRDAMHMDVVESQRRLQLELDAVASVAASIEKAKHRLEELIEAEVLHQEQYAIDMKAIDVEQEGLFLKTNHPLRAPLSGRVMIADQDLHVFGRPGAPILFIASPDMRLGVETWLQDSYQMEQVQAQVAARFGHLPWSTDGEFPLTIHRLDKVSSRSPWGVSGYRAVFQISGSPSPIAIGDQAEIRLYDAPRSLITHLMVPNGLGQH